MRSALFLSPHLDDAAFSCGATMARLADQGWRCVLATVFTASVPDPQGFALACQLDKGLGPDVDYMALRRDEDTAAARVLGAEASWLDLPEAPHRGYGSAPALFGPVREEDDVAAAIVARLIPLIEALRPALVLAPQALGGHVDHVQLVRALRALPDIATLPLLWWRDLPYAMRKPGCVPPEELPGSPEEPVVDASAGLERKLEACATYASQISFQFGDRRRMAGELEHFARAEGHGSSVAERFMASAHGAVVVAKALPAARQVAGMIDG